MQESIALDLLQSLWTSTSTSTSTSATMPPRGSGDAVVIILVDSTLLNMAPYTFGMLRFAGDSDSDSDSASKSGSTASSVYYTGHYTGHYILLIGYSSFRESFMYLDPARPAGDLPVMFD